LNSEIRIEIEIKAHNLIAIEIKKYLDNLNMTGQWPMVTRKWCEVGHNLVLFTVHRLLIHTNIGDFDWVISNGTGPSFLCIISHKSAAFKADCIKFTEARSILASARNVAQRVKKLRNVHQPDALSKL